MDVTLVYWDNGSEWEDHRCGVCAVFGSAEKAEKFCEELNELIVQGKFKKAEKFSEIGYLNKGYSFIPEAWVVR